MGNGDFDARDAKSGEKLWAYWGYQEGNEKGYVMGSPKLVDGVIYLSIWDNVFAFDPERRETL